MSVRARLGVAGYLFPIPGVSALAGTSERASSTRTTLGGRRVVQEAARAHRTWEVTLRPGSRPKDLAALVALAAGEWGRGPFLFASEWAQVTNLLTPRTAALDVGPVAPSTFSVAGPLLLADGSAAGRHLAAGGAGVYFPLAGGAVEDVPVEPDVPVTASAYTTTTGILRIQWFTAAGSLITQTAPSSQTTDAPTRLSLTATPPAGAALARMRVQVGAGGVVARPAFTWTPELLPYYPGQGVSRVRVAGLSLDVLAAWLGAGGQRAGLTFTVEEVG